jgi:hypothetical protein
MLEVINVVTVASNKHLELADEGKRESAGYGVTSQNTVIIKKFM